MIRIARSSLLFLSFWMLSYAGFSQSDQWTWVKGNPTKDDHAVNGIRGIPAISNNPGSGAYALSWKDLAGNFWLFGGMRYNVNSIAGWYGPTNNLWKYSPITNQWIWMKGTDIPFDYSIYGTMGVSSRSNIPGGRANAARWTDATDNFWFFGGYGSAAAIPPGFPSDPYCNDLWKYNVSNNQWTWMNGDTLSTTIRYGNYGTRGVTSPTNKPGGRVSPSYWPDTNNNLWLFGGQGYGASGVVGSLNDLWKYDMTTNLWTWVAGDSSIDIRAIQGSLNISTALNKPGGRSRSVSWTDLSGNFWLFGGIGYNPSSYSYLNDLWKYNPSINEWVWVKGDSIYSPYAVYGTMGTAAPANTPGGMFGAVPWTDNAGNLWMFDGRGYSDIINVLGDLHTIWKFDILTNEWTFVRGHHAFDIAPVYGMEGISAAANTPGSRCDGVGWYDNFGYFWTFGGVSVKPPTYVPVKKSDLWKYKP